MVNEAHFYLQTFASSKLSIQSEIYDSNKRRDRKIPIDSILVLNSWSQECESTLAFLLLLNTSFILKMSYRI